ncbi:MAG: hypothetical protein EPN93_14205 [Spirochaetes bacterium]|nr:MAG: hypothetical protein EPN93_14205 [Spirochaetota bacterium]
MADEKSYAIPVTGAVLSGGKKTLVLAILGALLLIAGSMYAVDWMILIFRIEGVYYAAIMKAFMSFMCCVLAILIGRNHLDPRDRKLLVAAFLCMVPIDITMSVIGVSKTLTFSGSLFMSAGVLSIIAHAILAVRHGRGFPYFRKSWKQVHGPQTLLQKYWILLVILATAVAAMALMWEDIVRINHQVIAPIYTAFFCFNTWVAWETVRYRLYPRPNAFLAALAMTGWYVTEIVGEISNIRIGPASDYAFAMVWVFYGSNVVLVALSGYRWRS